MSTLTSGLYRNRFRVVHHSGLQAPGFTYDVNRMPGLEVDNGTAVGTGTFFDGSNLAAQDKYWIPEVSGHLVYNWWRTNIQRGQNWLTAGIGDNDDLELSGVEVNVSGTQWFPVLEPGIFFDLDTAAYLYSEDSIEVIISGGTGAVSGCKAFLTDPPPVDYTPIHLGTFHVDHWRRARPYETYTRKHSFTSISGNNPTLNAVPGSSPPLYEARYTNIIWQDVDTTNFEFMMDKFAPGVVLNQLITSGVQCELQRVPWSMTEFQLPLVPVETIIGDPQYVINNDQVIVSNGMGRTTLPNISSVTLTSGAYVRLSGSVLETDAVIQMNADLSTVFPQYSGTILIDDGDTRQESIDYLELSGTDSTYISGLTRNSATVHRDEAQVRLVVDYASIADNNNLLSGIDGEGQHFAYYTSSGLDHTLDNITGLLSVPQMSGIHRAVADIDYYRGTLLCYEPSGATNTYKHASGLDINPLAHGVEHGMVWASMFPLIPASINIKTNRSINTDGTVGPVFAGNDFLMLECEVVTEKGAPVPGATVTMAMEATRNIGLLDGRDPADGPVSKISDGGGVARFAYTPPQTIQGLGYFFPSGNIINSSGLRFITPVPLEELWSSGTGWKNHTFAIYNDDEYLDYSETSGLFEFTVDGQFELITRVSGASASTGYTIFEAVQPVVALDTSDSPITASGTKVSTLVFDTGAIPIANNIPAYFTSAEKRISAGAMVLDKFAASKSVEVIVGIPPFMTGEFLLGAPDDITTSSFDSLAYLTVNPFEQTDPAADRTDPRNLGQVFRIQGTIQDEFLRNKFYVGIDYGNLDLTLGGRVEIKKLHTFRNRFIVEIT